MKAGPALAGVAAALAVATALYFSNGAPGSAGARGLAAEPYRTEIEALEAVLYQKRPPAFGDTELAARAAVALAEHVLEAEGRLAGRDAFARLHAFASETDARADVGYAAPDLAGPRRSWEGLRGELFRPAPWLRPADPGLPAAQSPPRPRAAPGDLLALRMWARALAAFRLRSEPELLAFGEVHVDVAEGSAQERTLVDDWLRFARRFDGELDDVARLAPPAPGLGDAEPVVTSHRLLGEALGQLRLASQSRSDAAVPDKAWRREGLANAARLLSEARARIAAAEDAAEAEPLALPAALGER